MTTFQIDTTDRNILAEIKEVVKQQFHFEIKIVDSKKTDSKTPKTRWGEFAEKMDGLFTPDIVEHIKTSRKEARDNFIANV